MMVLRGTDVLALPSNKVGLERDDRVYVLFRVATVDFRSSVEETALRDDLRSTIGIRRSFEYSEVGSKG